LAEQTHRILMSFDVQKMNKLPLEDRFFDVNDLWYFWNVWMVRLLYPTRITANQVTGLSLVMGVLSAISFIWGGESSHLWAGFFLYLKILLDNVDGNLARVRGEESRLGRFFDSLTDFTVSLLVYFSAMFRLVMDTGEWGWVFLALAALLSSYLHCSYFVYYLVKYTDQCGTYTKNRADESVTRKDIEKGKRDDASRFILKMQVLHSMIYGWQDRAIASLDRHFRSRSAVSNGIWYEDKCFMTWASPLCACTNNMMFVIFALADRVDVFFGLVVVFGNAYWAVLIAWKNLRQA